MLGLQAVAERLDLAQRLLEVVRGDEGEVLELAVAALELAGEQAELLVGLAELGGALLHPSFEQVVRGPQLGLGPTEVAGVAHHEVRGEADEGQQHEVGKREGEQGRCGRSPWTRRSAG